MARKKYFNPFYLILLSERNMEIDYIYNISDHKNPI